MSEIGFYVWEMNFLLLYTDLFIGSKIRLNTKKILVIFNDPLFKTGSKD